MNLDKISVFGLGYVGGTTAACFAKLGKRVYGVDVLQEKIDGINNGKMPFHINGLNELIGEQVEAGRLTASIDYKEALENTDISFVAVQTPCEYTGDIDMTAVERVCRQIREVKKDQLIVIRSTIFPNQIPMLEKILGTNWATNPEFLREATAIDDFFNPPFIIVGSVDDNVSKNVMKCYEQINTKKYTVPIELAHLIKYVNNSWHACKVAFTNEIGEICNEQGVNGDLLMGLFCEDNKLNVSAYYHKIGEPYGGHCLPKDLSVLQQHVDKKRYPLIHSISKSNNVRREYGR